MQSANTNLSELILGTDKCSVRKRNSKQIMSEEKQGTIEK
jgi:hypothetical protein